MTVKELYNLCVNNHWEDKELVIGARGEEIENYQDLTYSNVVAVSDFYHRDDSLKPETRVTLVI